jgi:hypothetical protein
MHIPWPVPFFKSKYDKPYNYNDDEDEYEEDGGEDDNSYDNRGRYGRGGYKRNYGQKPRNDYNNNKYQTSKYNNKGYDNDKEDSYGAKNYGRPRVDHGDKNGRNYVGNFNDDNDPSNYERRRTRKTYGNSG